MCIGFEKIKLNCLLMWDRKNPHSVLHGPFGCFIDTVLVMLSVASCGVAIYFFLVALGLLGTIMVHDHYDIHTGCPTNNPQCSSRDDKSICNINDDLSLYGGCLMVGIAMSLCIAFVILLFVFIFRVFLSCYTSYVNTNEARINQNNNETTKNDEDVIELEN